MPKLNLDDTICAIATPAGEGGIGIVRLSGKRSIPITAKVFRTPKNKDIHSFFSHTIHYGHVFNHEGKVIDEVMAAFFRAPHSYTREDMVEISAHGGMSVLRGILGILLESGARLAEPGEFTKRAFLNGRLDLSQAEAVLDLIRAKTERAREQAVRQLQGEFSKEIYRLKQELLRLCAHVEAYVDFPEDDIEVYSESQFLDQFSEIAKRIKALIEGFQRGSILRDGILTVIVGRPNVGKSSLLNALLDRDRAIVSEFPGTTRDALEEQLEIVGFLVRIVDTAGIRSDPNVIESIGIQKTREYMKEAQLFVMVVDGSQSLTEEDQNIYEEIRKKKHIIAVNKIDLPQKKMEFEAFGDASSSGLCLISVKNREGLAELEKRIGQVILNGSLETESPIVTNARHRYALEKSYEAICKAKEAFGERLSLEFIAFDLREALNRLGEIVGEIYTDDILDMVFREFCIGK